MRVFLLFVDGIGLGRRDPAANPFLNARLPHFTALLGGRPLLPETFPFQAGRATGVAVDAGLGVAGLPQSATGQATILTGINASQAIGRHLHAYPSPSLRALLQEHSLFRQVQARGYTATFVNAYRPKFFEWLTLTGGEPGQGDEEEVARLFTPPDAGQTAGEAPPGWSPRAAARRYRPSASTVAVLAAGLPFRTFADLAAGRAVYHDLDHHTLAAVPEPVAAVTPEEAGRRAAAIAQGYDFTMFEHFLTDMAGHSQDMARAVQVLENLDRFLGALLAGLDPDRHLLILISDHGNLEDLAVKTHTANPVPGICWGAGAGPAAARLRDLTDVAPTVLAVLEGE